jgi:hypothetical protein
MLEAWAIFITSHIARPAFSIAACKLGEVINSGGLNGCLHASSRVR